jgi:hypothetical protein
MRLQFKDYRKTNDAVMVADVGFKRQLRALDPELDVVWGGTKWEVWRFPGQGKRIKKLSHERAVHVMTVQTGDRSFREVGADILLQLQAGDTQRFSTKELCDYFDAMDDNIQRAKTKELENWLEDRRVETAWYTRGLRVSIPKRFMVGSLLLEGPSKEFKVRRAIANG